MTVTRTVEIPADHRLTIDVPREVPAGRAFLTLKLETAVFDPVKAQEAIEKCSGILKRMGGPNLSSDEFIKLRHQDKEFEDRKYRRLFGDNS